MSSAKSPEVGVSVKMYNIRVFKSPDKKSSSSSHKELISGVSRNESMGIVSFHCSVNLMDTLIEEQIDEKDSVFGVRFRHLCNPPPLLPLHLYNDVTTVHISCVVPIEWVFSIFSAMRQLKFVSFGSGCFLEYRYEYKPQYDVKLEAYSSVKEFIIRVDLERFKAMHEQRLIRHRIESIFDCAFICFLDLSSVDFLLPMELAPSLEKFRNTLTQFKRIGAEHKNFESGLLSYKANVSHHHIEPVAVPIPSSRHSSNNIPCDPRRQAKPRKLPKKKVKVEPVDEQADVIVITLDTDSEGKHSEDELFHIENTVKDLVQPIPIPLTRTQQLVNNGEREIVNHNQSFGVNRRTGRGSPSILDP